MNTLKDINMVIPFALTDEQLADWTVTIFRLYPESEKDIPSFVGNIVDSFLTGKEEYNKEIGIVNVTYRLKQYLGIY